MSENRSGPIYRRYAGVVDKWFDDRGYGFATLNEQHVFLHISRFEDYSRDSIQIRVGSTIEAAIINAVKGKQAVDVIILEY